MIKTILSLLLILPPTTTYAELITFSMCDELADVLMEAVAEGTINQHESEEIYPRCLKTLQTYTLRTLLGALFNCVLHNNCNAVICTN